MNTIEATNLADPDARPEADVVIWDGKCNFCRSQVQRLRWFDRRSQLAYLSLHDPRVTARYPDLSYQQLMDQLWLVTKDGRRLGGADAGRYLSRKIPGLWWLAPLLHIPFSMPLWRWLYQKVAQRRYRLQGGVCDTDGTCHLHSPNSKAETVASREGQPLSNDSSRLESAER
jgi:predicted DCC family thiol-disulfide oxidoreductase YuxK